MYQKLFTEGFCLGFTTAILIKYGVSLDPIYYGTLVLTTVSNVTYSSPYNSNPVIDLDSFISGVIIILAIIGILISAIGIFDFLKEVKDEPLTKLPAYGLGFIFGLLLVLGL